MKFTLPWLLEHLETDASVGEIGERLTNLGLEVDEIVDRADLAPFVVGEITQCGRHPDAEKLSLLEVFDGAEKHQVVCGAPNVREGLKGVFAKTGATIPASGDVLGAAVIRGVASNGMMCSARELLLGEDHDGIIELDDRAPAGEPAKAWLGVEDPMIDVDLTPDRADCFSVRGVARDLAASGLGRLKPTRDMTPVASTAAKGPGVRFDFRAPDGGAVAGADPCPLFVARAIRGVTNRPSPAWLQRRLLAVGLRPISALVDITNYVTYDLGRPLHVFDLAKLQGDFVLRFARAGEEIEALDGKTYALEPAMIAIADDEGPVSIAGVMGGAGAGCTEETTDVVLEVALFDAARVAIAGRALGIDSDARTRFERGLDPELALPAVEWATRLIIELCGGEAAPAHIEGAVPQGHPSFDFRLDQLPRLAGIALDAETVEGHLADLGFALEGGPERWTVTPPSWRRDITSEACVVEELARLHGYDHIPPVSVARPGGVAKTALTDEQKRRGEARRALAGAGLAEAVTWSFIREDQARRFGAADPVMIQNPLNHELAAMRPSLLPGLVAAAAHNAHHGESDLALFELGQRFLGPEPGQQAIAAAGLRAGLAAAGNWGEKPRPVDLFDAKADALEGLAAIGVKIDALQVAAEAPGHFHPGRSGALKLGPKTVLAHFGELHPSALAASDAPSRAVGFEIYFENLPKQRKKKGAARPKLDLSPYPAVERDFAFVVDRAKPAGDLLRAVRAADKTLIRDVRLFDRFEGEAIGADKVSLAIAVRLQSAERTLGEAEIKSVVDKIVANAKKACGAALRA